MARELYFYSGEKEYELARALWMVEMEATAKSFDRLPAGNRNAKCIKARKIINAMEEASGLVVVHYKDVDGG